jgi:HK97 family phage major capsid protein
VNQAEILKQMEYMGQRLEELANRPRGGGPSPKDVFGGYEPDWQSNRWPVQQLKQLSNAYGDHVANDLYIKKYSGGRRLSGIGPALVRMAAMSGSAEAKAIAHSMNVPQGYDHDKFEEEFGFTSITKAARNGVPRYDSATGKFLANERRKVALAENSGQAGGYIVPPQFMNELLTIAAEAGFIEQRAKVVPMNTRTVQWPTLDITTNQGSGLSPYLAGLAANWQPEAATIKETEPAFRQTDWTAWDLVIYTTSSNQLLADNGIGLDALLTQLFGMAITWHKEFAFLQGKGAGSTMPLGILNAPATIVQLRNTAAKFLLQDAAAMMSHLQVTGWDNACWIMHQSVLPQLIQMAAHTTTGSADTGAQLVWTSPYGDASKNMGPMSMKLPNAFLNNLPVYFTEKTAQLGSKGDVMLVDWSRYVIGTRLDLQIDVSPHVLFPSNQLAWRVVARCDGKPWLNNAITDQTGWTVSPFIVLQ